MKNKKVIGIIIAIVFVIIIIICSFIIYNKKQKNNIINQGTKIEVKKNEEKVNPTSNVQKPKMLTEKELAEKEKEAAEEWKLKKNNDKKYVTLEEAQDYIAEKSTELLIKEFPNEKSNEYELDNKMREILKTTITAKVMKNKFDLNGPKYDLNQFDIEIRPNDDFIFALNINIDKIIDNSNKYICITRTFSAE
ncbi:hypothetical protein ACED96_15080 [Clostridium thermobutyricum]|uniref:hypothetical protein n=1 Tax=uncultured Clostridium sp. TaxID=59620 RepID=UPI0025903DCA|nr:hypothetical protein [uncultured Clostridium sp.]